MSRCEDFEMTGFSQTLKGVVKKLEEGKWNWKVVLITPPSTVVHEGTSKSKKRAMQDVIDASGAVVISCALKPKVPTPTQKTPR